MKNRNILYYLLLIFCFYFPVQGKTSKEILTVSEVTDIIKKVNNHWQSVHTGNENAFWDNAAYHTGNMAAYEVTNNELYRAYSERWANHNQWKGARSDDKSRWKYSYGETDEHVLFGDWQICFQTYTDLYNLQSDERKIARAREVMEYQMSTPNNDYWWWADGLYMVMPVMTKLYKITENNLYLKKLHEYFLYAKQLMYDEESGLFYRDAKYVYPKHKTQNGKKDFWSRGNGWVFAALAKILQDLPANEENRQEYIRIYQAMAKALKASQQTGGYWTRSLLDEDRAPGYETSGTAFFTFGFLWGINNGILERTAYEETVQKAWKYLTETALQQDGTIGYVQPIGERADRHKNINERSTANFGTGAFLLAASEMLRFVEKQQSKAFYPGKIWKDNNGVHINAHGGGILYREGKYYWFGEHKDADSNSAYIGVNCYSSDNLYDWKNESVALSVEKNAESEITEGCIIERPKVIYNKKTGKYVMYFHLELKGKDYEAARVAIAVSDHVTGPYNYLKSYRPNAGFFPEDMTEEQKKAKPNPADVKEWWTPQWHKAVNDGLFIHRDFAGGQMSRDMTLFVDDNEKAYHIYSSEENLTLHLAELSDDYLSHTGRYIRIAPGGHNEAPAIFKKDGKYFLITSGCTGWAPNAARLFSADNIWGAWTQHSNPCTGKEAHLTFRSQSTFILPVQGKNNAFVFMADRWTPKNPINGRYIWLPLTFENGLPVLKWYNQWDLSVFDE